MTKTQRQRMELDVKARFDALSPTFTERTLREWAAAEATACGYGGVTLVHRVTGVARSTILRGIRELNAPETALVRSKQRRPGAGRPKAEVKNPELLAALKRHVEPATRGDPESALLWVSKSLGHLAKAMKADNIQVGETTLARLLTEEGFTLQKNRKVLDGANHPDRDAQFRFIQAQVARYHDQGQPVISIDAKKKELVGDYLNGGRDWHIKGAAPKVNTHDFPNGVPKAVPYGVYDIARNEGMVSVGMSGDTAEFAVASVLRWWEQMGKPVYPDATDLLIVCDCGGSNGYKIRLWRYALQRLADQTGLTISVAHMPPGTSKWNKIEHRLFSFISINWRGRPLTSYEVIVQLIGATQSKGGLVVRCELDTREYARGRKITDEELEVVQIERDSFHGEWNYTILPREGASWEKSDR